MKIKIDYLDNMLEINNDSILCLEIENKRYFYRIIENLYGVANIELIYHYKLWKKLQLKI